MHELQKLGAALVAAVGRRSSTRSSLPEELARAVREARRIRSHEARAASCSSSAG